jgi:YcaO-like protein with predicted kinase domain
MEAVERNAGSRAVASGVTHSKSNPDSTNRLFPALDLFRQKRVPIDRTTVQFPLSVAQMRTAKHVPTTTGLAAGWSNSECVVKGICECVERRVSREDWLISHGGLLPLSSVPWKSARRLISTFLNANIALAIVNCGSDFLIPTFRVFAADSIYPWLVTKGTATRFSPEESLVGALLEVAQSRAVAIQGAREDLRRYGHVWSDTNFAGYEDISKIQKIFAPNIYAPSRHSFATTKKTSQQGWNR